MELAGTNTTCCASKWNILKNINYGTPNLKHKPFIMCNAYFDYVFFFFVSNNSIKKTKLNRMDDCWSHCKRSLRKLINMQFSNKSPPCACNRLKSNQSFTD